MCIYPCIYTADRYRFLHRLPPSAEMVSKNCGRGGCRRRWWWWWVLIFSWKSQRIMAKTHRHTWEAGSLRHRAVQWCVWLISFAVCFPLFFLLSVRKARLQLQWQRSSHNYEYSRSRSSLLAAFAPLFSRHFHIFHSPCVLVRLFAEVVAHFWTFKPLLACVQLQKLPTSSCSCSCCCCWLLHFLPLLLLLFFLLSWFMRPLHVCV